MNDKELSDYLASGVKPKHPLDRMVNRIVNNIIDAQVIPWLVECLEKYDETDFHMKMMMNWDFIADWKLNHKRTFATFIRVARANRNSFDFDTNVIVDKIINVLNMKAGWTVSFVERAKLWQTIERLRMMIYS
jgi:hypothetical protein